MISLEWHILVYIPKGWLGGGSVNRPTTVATWGLPGVRGTVRFHGEIKLQWLAPNVMYCAMVLVCLP